MAVASFRYYESLNDFLPHEQRQRAIDNHFRQRGSVKDMIESMGVPHTEIDLIIVNRRSVDFSYIVADGDRISVFPQFQSLDISSLRQLRPEPLRELRFVLDTHLAKLARYLRLLGFDTLYCNAYDDAELAEISSRGCGRLLLTRDRGLLKRKQVTHGYRVRATRPRDQLRELEQRLELLSQSLPFSRCVNCNGVVEPVASAEVRDQLPQAIVREYEFFCRCSRCQKIYWRGSHYDRMVEFLNSLRGTPGQDIERHRAAHG